MATFNINKIVPYIAFFFVCVFTISGIFSLSAYNSSKDTAASIQVLIQDINRLDSRIEEFGKLINEQQVQPSSSDLKGAPQESSAVVSDAKKETTSSPSDEIKKMKEIIKSTGLDKLAETGNTDPGVIQELYEKQIKENEIQSRLSDFRELYDEQIKIDNDQHGDELDKLLRSAMPRRPRNKDDEEAREEAINELLEKYPDSYAAAQVVSMKTMEAARVNDINRAEEYYNMLVDIQGTKSENLVFRNGLEALPTVGHTLVWTYFRDGRTEDVKNMVNSLEENYYDSLYSVRSRTGPKIVSGEEAFARMRRVTGTGE